MKVRAPLPATAARTRSRKPGARPFCPERPLLICDMRMTVKAPMLEMGASPTRRRRTASRPTFGGIFRVTVEVGT